MIFPESEPAVAFGYGEARGRFEKDSRPPDNQHILLCNSSPSIDSSPLQRLVGSSCGVEARRAEPQARRAKPEADRLFSLADLRIGKRKLSVLGALSEAPGSGMQARAVQASLLSHWRLSQKIFQL